MDLVTIDGSAYRLTGSKYTPLDGLAVVRMVQSDRT